MLPAENSGDEPFDIRGSPGRDPENNSGDIVVRVQRQPHRQLAPLAMQPEQHPLAGATDWAVELFDVAELRGEAGEKLGRFCNGSASLICGLNSLCTAA
jgi:hypothetical protein